MNDETSHSPQQTPVSKVGKTIHPTTPLSRDDGSLPAAGPRVAAHTIYPEATKEIDVNPRNMTPEQHLALHTVAREAELADKRVSQRVKILYVIGGLIAISSLFGMISAILKPLSALSFLDFGVYGLQLYLGIYLVLSKNIHSVSLWLKVVLVLQLVSLFMSLANPIAFGLQLILVGVMFYAYSRVSNLGHLD